MKRKKPSTAIRVGFILMGMFLFTIEFELALQIRRYPDAKFLWIPFLIILVGFFISGYFFFRYMAKFPHWPNQK